MSGLKHQVTAISYFKYEEEKAMEVTRFFEVYRNKLPMLAVIVEGIYGLTRYDTFDCNQVVRIHCYTTQPRVLCMTEKDARKLHAKFISIPQSTDVRFRVVKSSKTVSDPLSLSVIMKSYAAPLLIKPESEDNRTIKIGTIVHRLEELGNLLILEKYEDHYFKQNCIDGSDLKMNHAASMLCMTEEITLTPITGFTNGSEAEFKRFLQTLKQQVAHIPNQNDTTLGDPNWTENEYDPCTQRAGGPHCPKPMKPTEALNVIQRFLDEHVTPLPFSKKPLAAPRHSVEDDEDNGDYEVPTTDLPPPPARPPKPRMRSDSSQVPPGTVPPRTTHQQGSNSANRNTSNPRPSKPTALSPSGIEVHARESGKKDGYSNTNIGRAVVRPQQQLPPTAFEVDEPGGIYSVPNDNEDEVQKNRKPNPKETKNQSAKPDDDEDDDDDDDSNYVYMEPDLRPPPPIPKTPSQPKPTHHAQTLPPKSQKPVQQVRSRSVGEAVPPKYPDLPPRETGPTNPSAKNANTSIGKPEPKATKDISAIRPTFAGVKELTIGGVCDVLRKLKLEKFVPSFKDMGIDGEIVIDLKVEDFVSVLGMNRVEAVKLHKYVSMGHVPK